MAADHLCVSQCGRAAGWSPRVVKSNLKTASERIRHHIPPGRRWGFHSKLRRGGSCRTIEPEPEHARASFHWLLECACGGKGGNPTPRSRPSPPRQRQSQRLHPPTFRNSRPASPRLFIMQEPPRHHFYCPTCWSCWGSGASTPTSCSGLEK